MRNNSAQTAKMGKRDKIFVAGHRGLVGSALVRKLRNNGYSNLILKTRQELNLLDQNQVNNFFKKEKPKFVFLAAAKVGGIMANNDYPADFIYENIVIQTNVIKSSHEHGVKKLLFLGSSCIYPRLAPQPMKEAYLLTGPLEPTNATYAVAKISGIIMCQSFNRQHGNNFISVMPTNLYGPNDNFDSKNSHVLPALIRKFHEAKEKKLKSVTLWGTGTAQREFLHVDDLADSCVYLMNNYNSSEIINIGTGEDVLIKELAELVKNVVGFKGDIKWDETKPDGMPRKLLSVDKIRNLGWKHSISLEDGLRLTYNWFSSALDEAKTKAGNKIKVRGY